MREGEGEREGERVCVGRMQRHLKPEPHELDPREGHGSVNKSGEKAPGPVSSAALGAQPWWTKARGSQPCLP